MALGSESVSSPLVFALAEAIRGAVRNTNRIVDHALASDLAVLVPCVCSVDVGDQRCVCRLSLPLPDRWMRAARTRRTSRRSVGPLPRRTCSLCRVDDHDLGAPFEMSVSIAGHGPMAPMRVAPPSRRSAKVTQVRASRAGALPPDAVAAQKVAAGVR